MMHTCIYIYIFSGEYTATDEVNGKYNIFTNRLCGPPVDKPRLGWRLNLLQYSSPQQVLQEVIELTYIFFKTILLKQTMRGLKVDAQIILILRSEV